jgi:hypothetical protein
MKLFVPIVIGAAALGTVAIVTHMRHEREMRRMHVPAPPTPQEMMHRLHWAIEEYIRHGAMDPTEVHRKKHMITPAVHDHCLRHLPHLLHRGVPPHILKEKCIAIAEKVCQQLHIQMKPRCRHPHLSPMGVGHIGGINHAPHKAYAVNIYELSYNHVPTPNTAGHIM